MALAPHHHHLIRLLSLGVIAASLTYVGQQTQVRTDVTEEGGKSAETGSGQPGQPDRSPPRCDSPRPETPVHHGRGG